MVFFGPFAQVINQVGAISLGAKLDCDGFADTHSSTAHYDPKSFVGLAWRPISECICAGKIHTVGLRMLA